MTNKKPTPRGSYIPVALDQYFLNGDAFIKVDDAYTICRAGGKPFRVFEGDLAEQFKLGKVCREGSRLYLAKTLRYENYAAKQLAEILQNNTAHCPKLSDDLAEADDVRLNEVQCEAVRMALSHRLSIILGGAGTGKSTLVKKIVEEYPNTGYVLCSPTGKAARNLKDRTGFQARTVHSALGLFPNEDALSPVIWAHIGLVVIDEASMLTLELLAGLLSKVRRDCRIVLVGDLNQLQSVGSGNVLPDLLTLGFPRVQLQQNFRQEDQDTALYHNVIGFETMCSDSELQYDESFSLKVMEEMEVERNLVEEAVSRYKAGESVQVLSPYNAATKLSVRVLNRALQARLNPPAADKLELVNGKEIFRAGDRVIITKNDRERHCANGDVGTLYIKDNNKEAPTYAVFLPDGRMPGWNDWGGLNNMALAYALTIHKSQGSQYDTVLFPVVERFSGALYRNLFYTAISRAKKQVILYGSRNALNVAIQTRARARRSMLVQKVRMNGLKKAV